MAAASMRSCNATAAAIGASTTGGGAAAAVGGGLPWLSSRSRRWHGIRMSAWSSGVASDGDSEAPTSRATRDDGTTGSGGRAVGTRPDHARAWDASIAAHPRTARARESPRRGAARTPPLAPSAPPAEPAHPGRGCRALGRLRRRGAPPRSTRGSRAPPAGNRAAVTPPLPATCRRRRSTGRLTQPVAMDGQEGATWTTGRRRS
eukprot:scaffold1798_cov118-Isochrysis_galbana.AAC.9